MRGTGRSNESKGSSGKLDLICDRATLKLPSWEKPKDAVCGKPGVEAACLFHFRWIRGQKNGQLKIGDLMLMISKVGIIFFCVLLALLDKSKSDSNPH